MSHNKKKKPKNVHSKKSAKVRAKQKTLSDESALPTFGVQSKFKTPFEAIQSVKRSVYFIAKLRPMGDGKFSCIGSGTGVLVRNKKIITCAHVVNNTESGMEEHLHKPGDLYMFVHRDEEGTYHTATLEAVLDESLHIYQDIDLAIFTIPESFYVTDEGKYILHPDHHVKVSIKPRNIGYEAAILGYPLQSLVADENENLSIDNIYIRADIGIVNTRFMIDEKLFVHEFTIPFNPGNSGGPVIDVTTGEVFALVQSFTTYRVGERITPIQNPKIAEALGVNQTLEALSTTYSRAYALHTFKAQLEEHGII